MKHLSLYLRAPMQSWGVNAKFGERPSLSYPSRSGVIGLLAAAAGIDRANDGWLRDTNSLAMRCIIFAQGRRLADYHTVGGGYDAQQAWSRRRMSPKAEGGTPATVLTNREYLQEAIFGIVLSGSNITLLNALADAIQNPVWGVWLGRKSCIPTEPLFAGIFDSMDDSVAALVSRNQMRGHRNNTPSVQQIVEVPVDQAEDLWHDLPVSFATRHFAPRPVRRETM